MKKDLEAYKQVREASITLCDALEVEDYALQAMPEVSPPKWHLAHTSWFFETFLLKPYLDNYCTFNSHYEVLFNSYYHGVGAQYPRAQRGLLSRPSVNEVKEYRKYIDSAMLDLLAQTEHPQRETILKRCELGIHHEQQHQELICTDIKYSFSFNPLYPKMAEMPKYIQDSQLTPLTFISFDACDAQIGFEKEGFCFDNELPVHQFHHTGFCFSNRLISNGEYLAFISDDGYNNPELWLCDGWMWKESNKICKPLYWREINGRWFEYTLYGLRELNLNIPVSHVNYYEADAYARWSGKRLPSEQEWETVSKSLLTKETANKYNLHPEAGIESNNIIQLFGSLWQWTNSNYSAYPGYRAAEGAIGEYNGKFMCNQLVLRGSSCLTADGHSRSSYRNFFYPKDRWQFTGIRLADDV